MANELIQSLTNDLNTSLDYVKEALPKDFNAQRFLQNTIAVVKSNPSLTQYNKKDLLTASLRAAYLGLDFMNGEAWIVPYGNSVQFQLGYKGACKFVKKYSIRPIADLYAKVVRKGDKIEYGVKDNGEPYLEWKPVPFNADAILGVFAVAEFKDGKMLFEVMTTNEVNAIRNKSKCGTKGPWVDHWEEMAKKTVLKRLCKNIETDFDNTEQREAWESDNEVYDNRPAPNEVVDAFSDTPEEVTVESEVVEEPVLDIPDVPQFKKD